MTDTSRNRMWRYQVPRRGSTAVEAMESAWELIREIEPQVPSAVLTLINKHSRGRVRGYFAHSSWKKRRGAAHEIAVSPKLIGEPKELLATMMHEAAHAVLFEAGKNGGMGSSPYYHTILFRDQAAAFGLNCSFLNTRYGWALTSWPASGPPGRYVEVIKLLHQELPAGTPDRVLLNVRGRSLPRSGHAMLVCGCDEQRRTVYVKKSVLEAGGVMCLFCGKEFRIPT